MQEEEQVQVQEQVQEEVQEQEQRQRQRAGVPAPHWLIDFQDYLAVVFAVLEEFVGFDGAGQGEDFADLRS